MMSDMPTKPTASPAATATIGATISPGGDGDPTDRQTTQVDVEPSSAAVPCESMESGNENAATADGEDSTSTGPAGSAGTGARKRVFTFQKRWLHTLPIMEKMLPDSALDAASMVALRAANLLDENGKPVDDAGVRDVVVCMLCDDPNANRETLKLWGRLNCRRGRIENHLMSKHPEFMLLLKQKRETEGDLAVQIFLQNMREGRCNVRNEISAGLYSHMQSVASVEGPHKRSAFGHDEFMMPTSTANAAMPAATTTTSTTAFQPKPPSQGTLNQDTATDSTLEAENRRKRLKVNGTGEVVTPPTPAEADGSGDLLGVSLLSYQGPAAFSQWRTLMTNKIIVVTGGESPAIARVATNLWLVGANVLVTFAEQAPMEAFAASYLTQFHTASNMEPPRGVMLPLFCSLRSRAEMGEWSRSISTKFGQVDYLLNFVQTDSGNAAALASGGKPASTSANRCRDLCEVFSSACMQRSGRNAIINITSETESGRENTTCTAVDAVTKSLSTQLQAMNVQVNSILLQQPDVPATGDEDIELIHLILFLLSPASACVSGSVLCHQRRTAVPVPHASDDPTAAPTTVNGTESTTPQPSDATTAPLGNGEQLETQVI